MRKSIRAHLLNAAAGQGTAVTVLIAACAASAGAHAGLVPEHWREAPQLGIAFILASVLLLLVVVALALRPEDRRIALVAALLLTGLIASWGASRVTGIPFLQPRPEPVDLIGLVTKIVEVLGLAFALWLSQPVGGRRSSAIQEVSR
jgi:cytochrome bd-type quinol oxidase subunit 2